MTKKEYRQLIAEQLSKARDDILYFTSFIYTVDTHALGENKVCRFPLHKEYLRKLLVLAMSAQRLAIYKSRQLLVTWSMCVIILHELLFNPGAYIGIISKNRTSFFIKILQSRLCPSKIKFSSLKWSKGFFWDW